MKTRALLLALPLLGVAACTDNGASIQIQQICAPSKDCTFSNKCDQAAMANPRLDTSVTSNLIVILQLANQLPDNSDADLKRLNTNNAHVDQAVVDYTGALSGSVTMDAQASIPAGGTQLIWIELIPSFLGTALTTTPPAYPDFIPVGTNLRLRGFYDDGTRFETAKFPLTVEVETGGTLVCANACPQSGQWPNACP
jgi:hypothetical protein